MPDVIAKIETREAVENDKILDKIIDEADGIMVARGDLGLQCELREVPGIQKKIIRKCNLRAKPVITATQMLDSMEKNPEPTRAEVTDVYNAIFDGTDAVMLSGETASGLYPFRAIRTMQEIAKEGENDFFARSNTEKRFEEILAEAEKVLPAAKRTTNRVSYAACSLSIGLDVKAIITPTTSGQTARVVSRFRPVAPIIGAAHDDRTKRKLVLSFGIWPLRLPIIGCQTQEDIFRAAIKEAKSQGYVKDYDQVVITAGSPVGTPGTTNTVRVQDVG
jgi:pyruvate kinase